MPFDFSTATPIKEAETDVQSPSIGFDISSAKPASSIESGVFKALDSDNVLIQTAKDLIAGVEMVPVAAGQAVKLLGESMKIQAKSDEMPVFSLPGKTFRRPKYDIEKGPAGQAIDRFLFKWGDLLSEWGSTANEFYTKAANTGMEAPNPAIMMGWKYPFRKVGSLAARNLPMLGVAAGITALTKNPAAGSSVFGPIAAGDMYEDAINNGIEPKDALDMAMLSGTMQTALETIPMAGWMKGGNLVKRVLRTSIQEGVIEEGLQQLFDNGLRVAGWDDSRPLWDRMLDGVAESVLSGMVTGGVLGAFQAPGAEDIRADMEHGIRAEGKKRDIPKEKVDKAVEVADKVINEVFGEPLPPVETKMIKKIPPEIVKTAKSGEISPEMLQSARGMIQESGGIFRGLTAGKDWGQESFVTYDDPVTKTTLQDKVSSLNNEYIKQRLREKVEIFSASKNINKVLQSPEEYGINESELRSLPYETEIAFRSEKSKNNAIREVATALRNVHPTKSVQQKGEKSKDTRATIADEIESRGFIDLRGREANGVEDVAELAAIFRHPKIEQFQVFYMKNGRVAAHRLVTSGAGNYVSLDEGFFFDIRDAADRLGADDIILAHNHPSGTPNPSQEDVAYTARVIQESDGLVSAHIVTNGTKYSVIRRVNNQNMVSETKSFPKAKKVFTEGMAHVSGHEDVAQEVKSFLQNDKLSIVFIDSANQIVGIDNVGMDKNVYQRIAEMKSFHKVDRYIITQPKSFSTLTGEFPSGLLGYLLVDKKGRAVEVPTKSEKTDRKFKPFKGVHEPEADDLATEAKKYNTAEGFVDSVPIKSRSEKRQIIKEWKKETGYKQKDYSYSRGEPGESIHEPADPESGSPLYDLTEQGTYPEDVYSINGLRYYGTGEDAMDRKAYNIISDVEGKPGKIVRIYRAVEKTGKPIQPGDWVTTVRQYAKEHGESTLKGDYKIVSKTVTARDLFTSGDSWLEYGYHPQESIPRKVYTKNKQQLTDIWNKAQGKEGVVKEEPAPYGAQGKLGPLEDTYEEGQRLEEFFTEKIEYKDKSGKTKYRRVGRINRGKTKGLAEELAGIPQKYVTGKGGISYDEAIESMKQEFPELGVENEKDLVEALRSWESRKVGLKDEIATLKKEARIESRTSRVALQDKLKKIESDYTKIPTKTRKEVKAVQEELISVINEFNLEPEDRAKLIPTIKNTQTPEQLEKLLPKVIDRINTLDDKETRRVVTQKIKRNLQLAERSKIISVDYIQKMRDLVASLELKGHRASTIAKLQATQDYIEKKRAAGEDVSMPQHVLDQLQILTRTPFGEIETASLVNLLREMETLSRIGKTKYRTMKAVEANRKARDLADIAAGSKRLTERETVVPRVGEDLTAKEILTNKYREGLNRAQRVGLAIAPMDVYFDMLDDSADYTGPNYRIFKKSADAAFGRYLVIRDRLQARISELAKNLGLNKNNFERIGFYAAAQQESGAEKLKNLGYTDEDISQISLTENEVKLYKAMRSELDKLKPFIAETMRVVYNKELADVENYFPFMTDFNAMSDAEIRERFGDSVQQVGQGIRKNVEMGFTKERVGAGKQKIKINAMDVYLGHVDNAAYLVTVGKETKRLGELAATPEYAEAVGELGQEMTRDWIDLLARKGKIQGRNVPVLDIIRHNTSAAVLAFKLSSALIQPTALLDAGALMGVQAFEGITLIIDPEWRQFLRANFPELRHRGADDPAYLEFGGEGVINKSTEAGLWALKSLDLLTASVVVASAYTEAVRRKGGVVDFQKPDKDAIADAERLLRRTQSSPFFKDVPPAISRGALTGNVSVDKLILNFQTFMLNRWSIIRHDAIRQGIKTGNIKKGLNILTFITLATIAETSIRAFARGLVDPDEPEEDDDEYWRRLAVNGLQNIPFVSQAVSSVSYGSYPVPAISYGMRVIERAKAYARSERTSTKERNLIRGMILAMGMLGVPGAVQAEEVYRKRIEQ